MIWVVADHPPTKVELVPLVQGKGYEAAHIDCVDDVPKRAKFRRPALLIIDCSVKGSFDLISIMREDPFTKQIPLIMFATSNEDFREEAMRRGAEAFVLKRSLDWGELLPEIQRLAGPPPGAKHAR